MYTRTDSPESIQMASGAITTPAYSLADEYGGIAHIILDDRCYILTLKTWGGRMSDDGHPWDGTFTPTKHWFDEAVKALRDLPPPSKFGHPDVESDGCTS